MNFSPQWYNERNMKLLMQVMEIYHKDSGWMFFMLVVAEDKASLEVKVPVLITTLYIMRREMITEKYILLVFENTVLRGIPEPKRWGKEEIGENCRMKCFAICRRHILLG
jgi:hypothetical protein